MKVLYINIGGPDLAGSEQSLLELMKLLRGRNCCLTVCNNRALVAAAEVHYSQGVYGSLEVLDPWSEPAWKCAAFARSVRTVLRPVVDFCPDIIHANSMWACQLAVVARGFRRIPIVCHIRAETIRSARELALCRFANCIVAVSKKVAEPFEAMRIRRGIVHVVYDPVSVPVTLGRAERVDDDRGDLEIAAAGRFSPEKGFDRAIAVLAWLRGQGVRARLSLYGDGPERAALTGMVNRLGLSAFVSFHGFRYDWHQRLAQSDVLIVPSLREGLGRVVIEAGLLGVPSIVVRTGGLPETIDDGKCGLLVDDMESTASRETIMEFVRNRQRLRETGELARRYCRHTFDAEKSADAIMDIYAGLLAGRQLPNRVL